MRELIERIQASGFQACIAVSGGGSGAMHELLAHPGASRFVLDVQIPYSREFMNEYLGQTPESYCSEETACKMAQTAINHASRFTDRPLGIACTAALQTLAERPDPDRAFICIKSAGKEVLFKLILEPGSREEQEARVSKELLARLAGFLAEQG